MLLNSCILSKFYIKPQHLKSSVSRRESCILSKFYIKPQQRPERSCSPSGCILSKFYIKPQRLARKRYTQAVVSYRNSTSNHNEPRLHFHGFLLYLIEILHQTTTLLHQPRGRRPLYLIEILHQTTTEGIDAEPPDSCILSKFYIKPQLVSCANRFY